MNFCKYCGKEISDKKKFCNSSCAAKYNNVHRVRKPWTEEQKERIRKPKEQKYCKYCGKQLVGGERSICSECKKYVRVDVFKKLNIKSGSAQERYFKALNMLHSMYFEDEMSLPEIWEKTGIAGGVVRGLFRDNGIVLRTQTESQQLALLRNRKDICFDTEFKSGIHTSWQGHQYSYRSSWELKYMKQLDEEKISYIYEPFRIKYFDTELQVNRVAVPDFYLPETNEIVELKSNYTFLGQEQNMKDKFKAYREAGYFPKLLLNWKFIDNWGV